MAEKHSSPEAGDHPEVVVKKGGISIVWIIPLLVIGLGGWLVYKSYRDAGIPITLTFDNADGLEAGKTKFMYKNVQVGLVDSIEISKDRTHVICHATMNRPSEDVLNEETRFWVVRPRITLQGISGLGTLLAGAYIEIEPGGGAPTREFKGLETPPVLEFDELGTKVHLFAEDLGSVSVGSPVYYRGILAGEVLSYELDEESQGVKIEAFVKAPHHKIVWQETQFWNASGIDVQLGANGLDIKTASLEALLIGGIAFETPARATDKTPIAPDTTFKLHNRHSDIDQFFTKKRQAIMYFEDSLRGLSIGAPVEFRGIQVGEVTDISVELDTESMEVKLPVTAIIEYDRFSDAAPKDDAEAKRRQDLLVARGLRVQLKGGSLITGELFVDIVYDPESPVRLVDGGKSGLLEWPTIPSTLTTLESSVKGIVTKLDDFVGKLDQLDLETLVNNASDAAASINELVSSKDLTAAFASANKLMTDAQPLVEDMRTLIRDIDADIKPLFEDADKAIQNLSGVFEQSEKTLAVMDGVLSPDSPLVHDLGTALKEFASAARSIRLLTAYLERHPEALIKGKPGSGGR